MKRKRMSVFVAVCFFVCIGIIDYPFLARLYNEQVQGQVASSYEEVSEAMNEDDRMQMYQKAVEYNEWLFSGNVSFGDILVNREQCLEKYEQLLCVGNDEEIAVVEIPEIHVRLPVYHGTSEDVLQKGAGHLDGSSLPVGGMNTHTCISAHRGLPRKKMFTNLDRLEKGDMFYLHVLGQTLAYEVYDIETVLPDQTDSLKIVKGKDLATLITCTPYGINTHRLYVHGMRAPYQRETEETDSINIKELLEKYGWVILTAGLLGWMMLLLYRLNRRPEKRRRTRYGKKKEKMEKASLCDSGMCRMHGDSPDECRCKCRNDSDYAGGSGS